jgi:hypothetical protein
MKVTKCDQTGPCFEQEKASDLREAYQVVNQCCCFCGVNLVEMMNDELIVSENPTLN